MKSKRLIVWILMLTLMLQYAPFVCGAEVDCESVVAADDMIKFDTIEALFSTRLSLEHNYEENREAINDIDQQLIQLGVEMLSTDDVISLIGNDCAVPLWDPVSTSTIQWTSRKLITTYRGYHFEVQIIEGIPISGNSPLRKNYANVSYKAEGITAGVTKAIVASTGNAAAEFLPGTLKTGVTILSMLAGETETIQESLSTSTVLDRVEGVAVISLTGHMKYIYVKPYETLDADRQGLYYFGNSVSCIVTTVSVIDVVINNRLVTYHQVETNAQDVVQSQYYEDYSKAVANYWNYNYNYDYGFMQDYTTYYMNLNILGNSDTYEMPWAEHPYKTY